MNKQTIPLISPKFAASLESLTKEQVQAMIKDVAASLPKKESK